MICQFGKPVRGISPYADALIAALAKIDNLQPKAIDYRSPFPPVLHPGRPPASFDSGVIQWHNPLSWIQAARIDGDILHIQHWLAPMAAYLAPIAALAKRAGKHIVITVHNPTPHEPLPGTRAFERQLLKLSDAIIVHDAGAAETLSRRFNMDINRIRIIPHGISISCSSTTPHLVDYQALGLDPSRQYICMFGNLRGYKGVTVLLRAWSIIANEFSDVDLIIAGRFWSGSGDLRSRLASKILGTNKYSQEIRQYLSHPVIKGRAHVWDEFLPDESIDSLLRISLLSIFPYVDFNSQSGAACRAAGVGCPVLVSNTGALSLLATGPDWISIPGNDTDLAARMIRLLTNPELLHGARQKQLDHAKQFEWSEVARQHQQLYLELASGRKIKH